MARSRTIALTLGASLGLALAAGPAAATHTDGVLDCGAAGTFEVQAASSAPLDFEAPGPWSGLFLLEGTNRIFRAFYLETPRSLIVQPALDHNPSAVVVCTLTSSGFNFEEPWVLVGFLTP
jgi:hypothetical protein